MSIFTTTAALAVSALAAAYGLGSFMSKSIATEIEIDAPVSAVWAAFSDTESYGDWNPFVRSITGDWQVGETLNVTVGADGGTQMDFTPTVLAAEENRELRWVGRLLVRGIFDGEHHFIFEQTEAGTTVLRHGETFTGMLAYVLYPILVEDTLRGFNEMNEALRARVEASL